MKNTHRTVEDWKNAICKYLEKEELRLQYRYLDLRRPDMQRKMILRSKVAKIVRDYYEENGFLEIETPILVKSTPEGARDCLVPSRVHNGSNNAIPMDCRKQPSKKTNRSLPYRYGTVLCFR